VGLPALLDRTARDALGGDWCDEQSRNGGGGEGEGELTHGVFSLGLSLAAPRPKHNRTSTGAKVEKTYVEFGKPSDLSKWASKSTLIQANPDDGRVKAALQKLSPNQRIVFVGLRMTKPPKKAADLAKQLGVKPPRITYLEKRAVKRMEDLMKVS
jgi:hypothetical protein